MNAFKAVLIGESNVGKTTLTKLLKSEHPLDERKPTVGVEISKVPTALGNMCVWDLAGQKRFQFLWDEFIRGSKLTILVTDSSARNVMLTKDLIERHLNKGASKIIAIANKQDLEDRMDPTAIEAALGVPTYGMVGINRQNESKLRQIIERHLK
ncbi:MAG: GTP-binding protein [Candidatus Lokiarchaeota archaeon]|nr:GTP-binding protein [Candidatus Harpocratesius repetitus]